MSANRKPFRFIGTGTRSDLELRLAEINPRGGSIGAWHRAEGDVVSDENAPNHPAGYIAQPELVDAVNTALILCKPLLLTGKPGTGKSELAERIAWEFNLGPVLRFDAQSLSEANDLFYRFDLVGQMGATQLAAAGRLEASDTAPERFISFGPLGKAILRSAPDINRDLFPIAFPTVTESAPQPTPSVVLIDEIDKASRDFPNDLLNGIDRLEFRIRERKDRPVKAPDDEYLRPIVIITSNSERDLPGPFLRRSTYFHIPDPSPELLRNIVRSRVFPESLVAGLPPLYEELLKFFMQYRKTHEGSHSYEPGTSELLDWAQTLRRTGVDETQGLKGNYDAVKRASSAVAKHPDDRQRLLKFLE